MNEWGLIVPLTELNEAADQIRQEFRDRVLAAQREKSERERLVEDQHRDAWKLSRNGIRIELYESRLIVFYDPGYKLTLLGGQVASGNTGSLFTRIEIAASMPVDPPPTGIIQTSSGRPTELQK